METKNREKILLLATGTVAALWLLDLLVVSPLIDSWHSRTDEIATLQKQISEANRKISWESSIHDEWNFMRANALPNNTTAAEGRMFTSFDRWVKNAEVVEGGFRPQVTDGDSNYMTVECRSDVSGGLFNIRDFMRSMSRDPLSDKLDSFELTAKDDNGQQLTLGLSMSGLILTDNDPSTVPPTPEPKPEAPAPADNTNSSPEAATNVFELIVNNNIFNQNRTGPTVRNSTRITRTPRTEMLTCQGSALSDGTGSAWFSGTIVRDTREYKVGDKLGDDLILAAITDKTVTITNTGTNAFILPSEPIQSLRRQEGGSWSYSSFVASTPAPDTNVTASASGSNAGGSAADSVLERLRKKRESGE